MCGTFKPLKSDIYLSRCWIMYPLHRHYDFIRSSRIINFSLAPQILITAIRGHFSWGILYLSLVLFSTKKNVLIIGSIAQKCLLVMSDIFFNWAIQRDIGRPKNIVICPKRTQIYIHRLYYCHWRRVECCNVIETL